MEKTTILDFGDEEINGARSKTSRVAELMPEIERLMKSGVSRQAILNKLNQQGFDLNMKTFASMLQRLRKRDAKPAKRNGAPIRGTGGPGPAGAEHAKRVHQQFSQSPSDRPQTVKHDLNKLPEW